MYLHIRLCSCLACQCLACIQQHQCDFCGFSAVKTFIQEEVQGSEPDPVHVPTPTSASESMGIQTGKI